MRETRGSIANVRGERAPHPINMWPARKDARTLVVPQ